VSVAATKNPFFFFCFGTMRQGRNTHFLWFELNFFSLLLWYKSCCKQWTAI